MIVKTEAIVLKRMNYGDTSRIVTLLTRDYGRISIIAKGARTPRSRFGPVLDTLNHLQVVIYKKEGRDLHLLSQCDLLTRFPRLTSDLHVLGCAMSVLDLVSAASPYDEESGVLFRTALESLTAMDSGPDPYPVLAYFQTRLLSILGFQPDFFYCPGCKAEVDGSGTKIGVFRLTAHGIHCQRCNPVHISSVGIGPKTLSALRLFQGMQAGWNADSCPVSDDSYAEERSVLLHLLRTHVDGVKVMKSGSVLSSIV